MAALDAANAVLARARPLYRCDLDDETRALLREYFLLTNKPVLAVVNVDEDDLDRVDEIVAPVRGRVGGYGEVIGICVQLEAEAAQFDEDERAEMLEGARPGRGRSGPVRARRLPPARVCARSSPPGRRRAGRGRSGPDRKAPQGAGVIHTDFERGFIRAEVIAWDELLEFGSWSKARDVGKLRVEGKDYEVADGDVVEFRFNV